MTARDMTTCIVGWAHTPFGKLEDPDVESLMANGAEGIDVLYICDADFSDRSKDPAVVANLRRAKFLVVQSWDAAESAAVHIERVEVIAPTGALASPAHRAAQPSG